MRIGLGCVNLGSATSALSWKDQINLVERSVDQGIRHFDTADAYGSGMSERLLGLALRGRSDQVTISTKGGYVFRDRSLNEHRARRAAARVVAALPQMNRPQIPDWEPNASYAEQNFSIRHLRTAIDASLRRLGTDRIDVYLLHGPPTVLEQVFADLDDLRQSGKVGRFGVGAESISSAADWADVPAASVVQLPFGILDVEARSEVFAKPRSTEVSYWARGVLGGGVLSRATNDIESLAGHPKHERVRSLVNIARDAGMGLDELAIRWIRSSPDLDLMLLGMGSLAHVERNISLAALPPLPEDVRGAVELTTVESLAHRGGEE